jgi:glycosyltransferase involved in cell wall biosynthesis
MGMIDGYIVFFSKVSIMISVIIPAYEKEKYIYNCLKSIVSQSYTDLEIIVVYCSGNDKTLDEIYKIHDKRLKIIIQIEKSGPGGARNIGIKESKGDYIGFVDCDDIIDKDFYMLLYNTIIITDADMALGEILQQTKYGNKYFSAHIYNRCLTDFYEKYSIISNGAAFDKLYKSKLIKDNNIFFPEGIFYEDNFFTLCVFYFSKKIALVKNAIYIYNITEKSDEHIKVLRNDILPAAGIMISFCKYKAFSKRDFSLVRKKILIIFAGGFVTNFTNAAKMNTLLGFNIYLPYILAKNLIKRFLIRKLRKVDNG